MSVNATATIDNVAVANMPTDTQSEPLARDIKATNPRTIPPRTTIALTIPSQGIVVNGMSDCVTPQIARTATASIATSDALAPFEILITPIKPRMTTPKAITAFMIPSNGIVDNLIIVPLSNTSPITYTAIIATSVASGSLKYLNAANIPPIPTTRIVASTARTVVAVISLFESIIDKPATVNANPIIPPTIAINIATLESLASPIETLSPPGVFRLPLISATARANIVVRTPITVAATINRPGSIAERAATAVAMTPIPTVKANIVAAVLRFTLPHSIPIPLAPASPLIRPTAILITRESRPIVMIPFRMSLESIAAI